MGSVGNYSSPHNLQILHQQRLNGIDNHSNNEEVLAWFRRSVVPNDLRIYC